MNSRDLKLLIKISLLIWVILAAIYKIFFYKEIDYFKDSPNSLKIGSRDWTFDPIKDANASIKGKRFKQDTLHLDEGNVQQIIEDNR